MRYAVITSGGKQYKVSEGETILVDKLPKSKGDIVFDQVFLLRWDDTISMGAPTVAGATVTAKILGDEKGEKLRISKFKSKVRYRRSVGFRARLTRLEIVSINSSHKKPARDASQRDAGGGELKPVKKSASVRK